MPPTGGEYLPVDTGVSLEYWGTTVPESVMITMISDYRQAHPNIEINYSQKTFDNIADYKNTLLTRLHEGSGPDIFRMHSTWTNEYFSELSSANNDFSTAGYGENYYPVAKRACTSGEGGIYCIPIMYDGLVLLYNRDLFANEGLGTLITWEDLRSAALELGGVALGTTNNVRNSADIFGLMLAQSEVLIPDDLTSAGAEQALKFYRDFADVDKVWSSEMPDSIVALATNKVAMAFGTRQDVLDLFKLDPTYPLGIMPVPQLPLDPSQGALTTSETWASFWVEGVSADLSDHARREAWDFLVWLSQPEQQTKLFTEMGVIEKFGEIPANKKLLPNLVGVTYVGPFIEQAPTAVSGYFASNSGNEKYIKVMTDLLNSKGDSKALQSALDAYKEAQK